MTRQRPATKYQPDHHDHRQLHTAGLVQRPHPRWLTLNGASTRAYSASTTHHGPVIVPSEADPGTPAAHIRDAQAAHRRPAWAA